MNDSAYIETYLQQRSFKVSITRCFEGESPDNGYELVGAEDQTRG